MPYPEAKDRQNEGVARVVSEQVVCPQQALMQGSPQEVALAAHPQQLLPPLLPLAALRQHLQRSGTMSAFVLSCLTRSQIVTHASYLRTPNSSLLRLPDI